MWFNVLAVAIGGALGSVSRFLITKGAEAIPGGSTMVGTTVANLLGCAAIGGFAEFCLSDVDISERLKLAVRVGFLGGLTTFSTFAAESSSLASDGKMAGASLYVASNVFVGWLAVFIGASVVKGWMS